MQNEATGKRGSRSPSETGNTMTGAGRGPFLWLAKEGSPFGFHQLPPGGLCLSAFVFLKRGPLVLLGKYADDPAWERLAGIDVTRRRAHGRGWTIPASHLRYGENPRDAGRRIAEEILLLPRIELSELRVETEFAVPERFPDMGRHYDVWFFLEAELPQDVKVETPAWYRELEWLDPRELPASAYGRSHEDIIGRWLRTQGDEVNLP